MTVDLGGKAVRKGVDTTAGKIALALGVAVIILGLATRKGSSEEPRTWPIVVVPVAGIALASTGALASAGAAFIYNERATQAETITMGPGPAILLAAGIAVTLASWAGLLWRAAWRKDDEPAT